MSTTPGSYGRFIGTLEVPEKEIADRVLAALESRLNTNPAESRGAERELESRDG